MILQIGHPVLRQSAKPIPPQEIKNAPIQELIRRMHEIMDKANGVGLAAPQIGISLQLAVIEDNCRKMNHLTEDQIHERDRVPVRFQVIINPTLQPIPESGQALFHESCLSMPYPALVRRHRTVHVRAYDSEGKLRDIRAEGWYARILQHEIDHLDGSLYTDFMEPRSLSNCESFDEHWKGKTVAEVCRELNIQTDKSPAVVPPDLKRIAVQEFADWLQVSPTRLSKGSFRRLVQQFLDQKKTPERGV